MHTFNPSHRENYKIGADSFQSQSHSEIPGGRIAILDWGRGKSQWLDVLLFWPSSWTPISVSGFLLIVLHLSVPDTHWVSGRWGYAILLLAVHLCMGSSQGSCTPFFLSGITNKFLGLVFLIWFWYYPPLCPYSLTSPQYTQQKADSLSGLRNKSFISPWFTGSALQMAQFVVHPGAAVLILPQNGVRAACGMQSPRAAWKTLCIQSGLRVGHSLTSAGPLIILVI